MEQRIVLISTLLWVVLTLSAAFGAWLFALYVLIALLALHVALGTLREGQLDVSLLLRVVLPWGLVWSVAFLGGEYFAARFEGARPDFTVAGLHPSFAVMVGFYWLLGTGLITTAFYRSQNHWLSPERWAQFQAEVSKENESP